MTAVLCASSLSKRFGGLLVTSNVSLALEAGARHALIGPNGAGKTTLVGLLSGAIKPDEGSIYLFDQNITRETRQSRARKGLVRTFQVNNLFAKLTALENILIALNEAKETSRNLFSSMASRVDLVDRAKEVLSQVGLVESKVPVAHLPYGSQRLVELAIALSLEPKVILLDEPCAGVPTDEVWRILDVVSNLSPNVAVLMIEHDMAVVRRFATEITVLVSGSVLLSGQTADVLENSEVHRVYLGRSSGSVHNEAGRCA